MESINVDHIMNMNPCSKYTEDIIIQILKDRFLDRLTIDDVFNLDIDAVDKIWLLVETDLTTIEQCSRVFKMMCGLIDSESEEYTTYVNKGYIMSYRPIVRYFLRTTGKPGRQIVSEVESQILDFFKVVI